MTCINNVPCPEFNGLILVGRLWDIYNGVGISNEEREKYITFWKSLKLPPLKQPNLSQSNVKSKRTLSSHKKCGCEKKKKRIIK